MEQRRELEHATGFPPPPLAGLIRRYTGWGLPASTWAAKEELPFVQDRELAEAAS